MIGSFDERKELLAHLFVGAERSEHRGGDHLAVLLLDAAHHHAEMLRLDDDADALRLRLGHDGVCDLLCHALLNLQAAREHVDDAGELRDAEHLALRDVADRALAVERQHVVLAHRVELDVLQDHHVVRAGREVRAVHDGLHLLPVALRQERKRLRDPHGGFLQPLAIRILPQLDQQFPDKLRDPLLIWFSRFQDFRP